MKIALLVSVCLAACATGEPTLQVGFPGGTVNKPRTDVPKFPGRVSAAEFPSARAIAPRLLVEGPMTAGVDVCVRPSGDTALVRLRHSSGDRRFDAAILEDVQAWKYEPGDHVACEQATINYAP
jgi:TonB family protein